MTVNQKIERALSNMVNGNIWPLVCPLETPPDVWITYLSELDVPEDFGDDKDLEWVHHMQVHWFKKGLVNYFPVRKEIRKALQAAGFTIEDIIYMYEKDTKTTHLVFTCSIIEEDD